MPRFIRICATLLLLASVANPVWANIARCEARASSDSEWEIEYEEVCVSGPDYWAAGVLSDVLSISPNDYEDHLKRIQTAYFSETGWDEFKAIFDKARFIEKLKNGSSPDRVFFTFKHPDLPVLILENKTEDDFSYSSVKAVVPITKIWKHYRGISPAPFVDSGIYKISFEGAVNDNLRLMSDVQICRNEPSYTRQYHYKITSFELVTPAQYRKYSETALPKPYLRQTVKPCDTGLGSIEAIPRKQAPTFWDKLQFWKD